MSSRSQNTIPNLTVLCTFDDEIDAKALIASLQALDKIHKIDEYISNCCYADAIIAVREAWESSSTHLINVLGKNEVVKYIELLTPSIMNVEEIDYLNDADDELIVFRGASSTKDMVAEELSWTYNEATAATYATFRNGYVYKGIVNKENILCVLLSEQELIIRPGSVTILEQYLPQ